MHVGLQDEYRVSSRLFALASLTFIHQVEDSPGNFAAQSSITKSAASHESGAVRVLTAHA
jgi:hypothetical protein